MGTKVNHSRGSSQTMGCLFMGWGLLGGLVCPVADFMLQSMDTVSLGMSNLITESPMALLTHLQSHSWELTDAGVGKSESAICESKIHIRLSNIFFYGVCVGLSLCLCYHYWMWAMGSWTLRRKAYA